MNTNCGKYLWNGERINCWAGSPNYKWLQNDLAGWKAANPSPSCVAVIGHALRFSSGAHGNTKNQHAYWKLFYNNRVDVVLNGHDHDYERFAPQRSIKTVKSDGTKVLSSIADANGPREFVSGPGGKSMYSIKAIQPNSQVFINNAFGHLRLVLRPGGYDWQFITETGVVRDSGSASCI
jgi:hypothetical protein